jgi:glycosyltransferase involved in cell wall biosynthesis
MKVSVVIPTYNEVDNLEELFSRIRRSLEDYEVVVVDDGSPDGTAEVARRLNGVYGEIRVLNRGRRLGLASAVLGGLIVNFTVLLGLASLGLPAWLADLGGVLLGFAANYIASELYVWRK